MLGIWFRLYGSAVFDSSHDQGQIPCLQLLQGHGSKQEIAMATEFCKAKTVSCSSRFILQTVGLLQSDYYHTLVSNFGQPYRRPAFSVLAKRNEPEAPCHPCPECHRCRLPDLNN